MRRSAARRASWVTALAVAIVFSTGIVSTAARADVALSPQSLEGAGGAPGTVTGRTVVCGDEYVDVQAFWIYVAGEGSCRGLGDGVVCTGLGASVEMSCAAGCLAIEGDAGCVRLRGDGTAEVLPMLDVECSTEGKTYRITDGGGECEVERSGDAVTGGHCTRHSGGTDIETTSVRCDTGCQYERLGGSCQCVRGCAGGTSWPAARVRPRPVADPSPRLDVECEDSTYRIVDENGECQRNRDHEGATTGGSCSRAAGPTDIQTTEFSCDGGCQYERLGATCRCMRGCEG